MIERTNKFEFWVQRVLPQVYDESLSYYELLNKVVSFLNDVISQTNGVTDFTEKELKEMRQDIAAFLSEYDDNLSDTVARTLGDWQSSGKLKNVVAVGLQWELDDFKATNEQNLLSINQQLAQKADKSQIGAPTQEQIDDWLNRNPDATSTVADNSLATIKYKNQSVTPRKTSFFEKNPKSLVDPFNFVSGYIDAQGVLQPSPESMTTDYFIPLNQNSVYTLQTNSTEPQNIFVAFYNADNVFTRRFGPITSLPSSIFITGINDYKAKITCLNNAQFDLYFHEGSEASAFVNPLVITNKYIQGNDNTSLTSHTNADYPTLIKKYNQSNKPLKAKIIGDRVFHVYQPIAEGKYVGHFFSKDVNDDFVLYESAVVGELDGEAFNPEQYLMAGSNKEFAFRVTPQGQADQVWVPEHENQGTAFAKSQRIMFDSVDVTSQITTGQMVDVEEVLLEQVMECNYPNTETPFAEIIITTAINSHGVTYNGRVNWLGNAFITSGYINMLPAVAPVVNAVRTPHNTFPLIKSTGRVEIEEPTDTLVYLNSTGGKYVIAQKTTVTNREVDLWIEERSDTVKKVYPQVYENTNVKNGDYIHFGANIFVGVLNNAFSIIH